MQTFEVANALGKLFFFYLLNLINNIHYTYMYIARLFFFPSESAEFWRTLTPSYILYFTLRFDCTRVYFRVCARVTYLRQRKPYERDDQQRCLLDVWKSVTSFVAKSIRYRSDYVQGRHGRLRLPLCIYDTVYPAIITFCHAEWYENAYFQTHNSRRRYTQYIITLNNYLRSRVFLFRFAYKWHANILLRRYKKTFNVLQDNGIWRIRFYVDIFCDTSTSPKPFGRMYKNHKRCH